MSRHISYRIPSELASFIDKLAERLGTREYSKALTFSVSFTRAMLDSEEIGRVIAPSMAKAYETIMKTGVDKKKM